MKIEVFPGAEEVARHGAACVAEQARLACRARGRFTLALSGGTTPWKMMRALADESVPWQHVHVFQVDERFAPAGDPERNWTQLRSSLLSRARVPETNLHPMPVEAPDPEAAMASYAATLEAWAGRPPELDLVHLGLGGDGHTASLVPDDPVLDVTRHDVALTTHPYQNRRRMTLTYPCLNRARCILWLVTGESKAEMLARVRAGDPTVPAGRIRPEHAVVLADRAAAGGLERDPGA